MKLANDLIQHIRSGLQYLNLCQPDHPEEISMADKHENLEVSVSVRTDIEGNMYRITQYIVKDYNVEMAH